MANTSWNPADKTASVTLSGSNLIATNASVITQGVRTVDRQTVGKFYWEITLANSGNTSFGSGCANSTASLSTLWSAPTNAAMVYADGTIYVNNVNTGLTVPTFLSGGILCLALDLTGKSLWARNGAAGNWNGSGTNDPATGVGGINVTAIVSTGLYGAAGFNAANTVTANFGDSAFSGVVPAGFTAGFSGGAVVGGTTQARAMVLA